MRTIDSLPPIQEIVRKYKLYTTKKFGQNFLFDLNITDKIVRSAGILDDCTIIEIGPGPGALTRSLLQSDAKKIIAVDTDQRCIDVLADYLVPAAKDRLELVKRLICSWWVSGSSQSPSPLPPLLQPSPMIMEINSNPPHSD